MSWKPYIDAAGRPYDLAHLHPCVMTYRLPPTVMRPATDATVRVTYGMHCFTRGPSDGEVITPDRIYFKNPEGRVFCPDRWELTADLPRIINTILERNCFETDRRNHVLFSTAQTESGEEYAVFFALRRAGPDVEWDANLMVISAHRRDGFRKPGKPQKFRELLRQVL